MANRLEVPGPPAKRQLAKIEPQVGDGSAGIVFASSGLRVFAPSRETGTFLISSEAAKGAKPAAMTANHYPSISLEKRTHDECRIWPATLLRARAATLA